jgi:chemotaxis protein MotB
MAPAPLESPAQQLQAALAAAGRADGVTVAVRDADLVVTLSDRVSFPSGSAELLPEAAGVLEDVRRLAASMPGYLVDVAGHTDDVPIHTPLFPSNLALSAARAERVARELGALGPRVTVAGFADLRPVAPNADAAGRARNRRVEIRFVPVSPGDGGAGG